MLLRASPSPLCPSRSSRRALQPLAAAQPQAAPTAASSRRQLLQGAAGIALLLQAQPAQAGFNKELKKKKLTPEDYELVGEDGLKYVELVGGKPGAQAIKIGDRVLVHFDVLYRGINVLSSRSSRLLGGNRTIAEPFEFVAGQPVAANAIRKISDSSGGLFSGQGGPRPPKALSTIVYGMRRGEKRAVLIEDPELGYGGLRMEEIPANAAIEVRVEILDVFPKAA